MKEMAKKYFVDIDKRTKLKKERKKQKKEDSIYDEKKDDIFIGYSILYVMKRQGMIIIYFIQY